MSLETIHWHAPQDQMPDADQTVLILAPTADEPVWLGYHDGENWREVSGEISPEVTYWAQVPTGPTKAKVKP